MKCFYICNNKTDIGYCKTTVCIHPVYSQILDWDKNNYYDIKTSFPNACRQCSNNPANGGSGICHCILGSTQFMC